MDADSIGGVINLRSKSAFDTPRRILTANAHWQYTDLAEQSSYRGGLTYSDVFGAGRNWGFQLSLSHAQRKALEETNEPAGWALRAGTAAGGAYAGYSPNNIPFTYVDIKRERTGGSTTLERKFGTGTLVYLRASHNEFIEWNGRPRFVLQNAGNIATAQPVSVAGDRIVGFTSTAVRGQRVVNPREFTDTGSSLALGGKATAGAWALELVGAFSRGTNHQDAITGQWQTTANTTGTFDLADSERPRFVRSAGPDLNDASAYAFNQLQIQDRSLRNREYSLKGDARRDVALGGVPLTFSTGFKVRWSPKRWDQENQQFNTLTSGTLALSDPRLGGAYEVKRGFLDDLTTFGPTVAPYGFRDFVRANPGVFVPNAGTTLQNTLAADYYVREEIQAGYAMAEWKRGPLTVLGGLRAERTATESKAYRQDTARPANDPARYVWVRQDDDYANVLPGLHVRHAPTRHLVLRASWNETLARPQTNRIAPSLNVTTPAVVTESDRIIVSGGNPNLEATTSRNFDVAVEYYLQSIGLVSAGWFHKRLDGPIYRRTYDGTYEGQPARLTVFDNAGRATVSGAEVSYQQQLAFLPAPLDGLGVYANVTLVDSRVTLTEPGRVGETLPLFNQSDFLGNLALTYQKHGFFVRVSHHWHGDFLQALGTPGLDQFARGFESYDVLASYKLNRRWTLKLEATNLTNRPEQQYVGTSERNLYYGDTGRSFALGLTWSL
jgi:TonB-dependent receptor